MWKLALEFLQYFLQLLLLYSTNKCNKLMFPFTKPCFSDRADSYMEEFTAPEYWFSILQLLILQDFVLSCYSSCSIVKPKSSGRIWRINFRQQPQPNKSKILPNPITQFCRADWSHRFSPSLFSHKVMKWNLLTCSFACFCCSLLFRSSSFTLLITIYLSF